MLSLSLLFQTEMARDVASNVEKLLRSSNPYLRKKVGTVGSVDSKILECLPL